MRHIETTYFTSVQVRPQNDLSMNETFASVILPVMKTIGQRIKAARQSRGWTQHEFAAEIGVSRGAIGNWELGKDGKGGITLENLERVAEATAVSVEWLRTGSGPSGMSDSEMPRRHEPLTIDVEFLEAILAATFEAMNRPRDQAAFLASALIGAARRPRSERESPIDQALVRSLALALTRSTFRQ
jgi:transcriptional regulator with XRE-family HTH domain